MVHASAAPGSIRLRRHAHTFATLEIFHSLAEVRLNLKACGRVHVNPAVICNQTMADEIEPSDSKLEDTIGFVLAFLRDVGLDKAESALLQEIGEKYPDLGAPSSALSEEEIDAEGEEPAAAPEASREERCVRARR